MNQLVVLGLQWGDEGKGKLVDLLTDFSDFVVRFQGGGNAGHTLLIEEKKFILHMIPSGILHDDVVSIIANGVVVDLEELIREIDYLRANNVKINPEKLKISHNAHITFPYHKLIDGYREEKRLNKIGTTKKGVGPTYEDKVARRGIRLQDFLNEELFETLLKENVEYYNLLFTKMYSKQGLNYESLLSKYNVYREELKDYISDVSLLLSNSLKQGSNLLFEGAQGALLDIEHGTYPYVTSSHTTSGGAVIGSGVGPSLQLIPLGIFKAYTTRDGEGPFPTELNDEIGEALKTIGHEHGTVLGRDRRCGWLDIVALKYTVRVNGIKKLALTKLDVLSSFEEIKVCTAYIYKGKRITNFINDRDILENSECEYEVYSGWNTPIDDVRSFDDLPENAKRYINSLETILEIPIEIISVGAERNATILKVNPFRG